MKKLHHTNINQKKAGVAVLISVKVDFRTRNRIKTSIHQEDKTILTVRKSLKSMKQKQNCKETYKYIIIVDRGNNGPQSFYVKSLESMNILLT
jgi:hypothetical protein